MITARWRLGVDALVLVHAALPRALPRAKASYWRTAFRLGLHEIAALLGLATNKPGRPSVPER